MWAASCTTTIWLRVGEVDDALVEVARRDRPGRAVRVVDDQQLRPLLDVGRDAVEVGKEAVLLQQRQLVDLAAVVLRVRAGDRVAGHGHQRDVAGVDEARPAASRSAGFEPMQWLTSVTGSSVTPNCRCMNSAAASL